MRKLYILASFYSAFLLFMVQPMLAKTLLPMVGGAPAVWVVSMMFFQLLLLGGYAYAAAGSARLRPAAQSRLHLVLFALAILITIPLSLQASPDLFISALPLEVQLLLILLVTVGAPYAVLSAHSSLLQRWYYERFEDEPYHLFSASNLGSFTGLLGYPLFLEWQLPLSEQMQFWSAGYVLLFVLFLAIALSGFGTQQRTQAPAKASTPLAASTRWKIIYLSFFPSSLFLSVTLYVTTDVASFPLLWVIPLALYLLSLAVAFSSSPVSSKLITLSQAAHPVCLVGILACAVFHGYPWVFWLHFLFFFIIALSCHGHLSQIKPQPSQLTSYFFWLTFGGALGGVFNVLVPYLLSSANEYFYIAILSIFALRGNLREAIKNLKRNARFIALFVIIVLANVYFIFQPVDQTKSPKETLFKHRNFFGVSHVYTDDKLRYYGHGTTLHGIQSLDPKKAHTIASYYVPLQQLLHRLPNSFYRNGFAVLGLGAGTLACLGKPGQIVDFYEIDRAVIDIAKNQNFFTYLSGCHAKTQIILGDGRLEIAKKPDGIYSLIVADAFTSDSVPLHLLTKEAAAMYISKLIPKTGIIAYNVSNRYLDLAPFVARVLSEHDWDAYYYVYQEDPAIDYDTSSLWLIGLPKTSPWRDAVKAVGMKLVDPGNTKLWTDDYSNLLHAFKLR